MWGPRGLGSWKPEAEVRASLAASPWHGGRESTFDVGAGVVFQPEDAVQGVVFQPEDAVSGSLLPWRSGVLEDPGLLSPCKSLELSWNPKWPHFALGLLAGLCLAEFISLGLGSGPGSTCTMALPSDVCLRVGFPSWSF